MIQIYLLLLVYYLIMSVAVTAVMRMLERMAAQGTGLAMIHYGAPDVRYPCGENSKVASGGRESA